MSAWKLGVHGLPSAEAGLVRALLSLVGSGDPGWRWTFAAAGPCDVLLADAAVPSPGKAQSERQARALLLLGPAGSPASQEHLQRPLRPNELESALRRLASVLGMETDAPAAPAGANEPPTLANARFKLLRWPPAALLRGEVARLRMATQLSRRFLSVAELATLTNQEPGRCLVFLQLLQGFQLLQAEPATALPASGTAATAPTGGWALVRSIRRRLGL